MKKKNSLVKTDHKILLGLGIILILGLGFILIQPAKQQSFITVGTGTTEEGDVRIELTPAISDTLEVSIAANTHSVDLSKYDLMEITTLQTSQRTLAPTSAPTLSGHHATGKLVFETNKKELEKGFTITIRGIPATGEREFKWL